MAITTGSFVPEKRGVQGPDNYSVGMAKNVDAAPSSGGDSPESQIASYERNPSSHPITGTSMPAQTGAGAGTIRRGGRGGR